MREKVLTLYSSNNRKSGTTTEFINLPKPFLGSPTHAEAKKREFVMIIIVININKTTTTTTMTMTTPSSSFTTTPKLSLSPPDVQWPREQRTSVSGLRFWKCSPSSRSSATWAKWTQKRMNLKDDLNFRPSSSPSRRTSSRSWCTSTSTGRGGWWGATSCSPSQSRRWRTG